MPFFKKRKENKYITDTFSQFVDEDITKQVLEGKSEMLETEESVINYIIIQIKDHEIEKIPDLIEKAVNIIIDNDGIVDNIFNSLIFGRFGGIKKPIPPEIETCQKVGEIILFTLKYNVKAIYGSETGLAGFLGNKDTVMQFGSVIPQFNDKMKKLSSMDYGELERIE